MLVSQLMETAWTTVDFASSSVQGCTRHITFCPAYDGMGIDGTPTGVVHTAHGMDGGYETTAATNWAPAVIRGPFAIPAEGVEWCTVLIRTTARADASSCSPAERDEHAGPFGSVNHKNEKATSKHPHICTKPEAQTSRH